MISVYDSKGRCAHAHPRHVAFMIDTALGGQAPSATGVGARSVLWCPDCGALKARHPTRYGRLTRHMWRRVEP